MRFHQHVWLLLLAVCLSALPKGAHAQGCVLDGIELDCSQQGQAGSDAAITDAFASAGTRAVLANPLEELGRFERPIDRETFRRSLEKNWESVRRHELAQRRKLKRRQMSAAEFENWSSTYDDALLSYQAGLDFYRALIWQTRD